MRTVRLAATSIYQATVWQRAILACILDHRSVTEVTYSSLDIPRPGDKATLNRANGRARDSSIRGLLGKGWIEIDPYGGYRLTQAGKDATSDDPGPTEK